MSDSDTSATDNGPDRSELHVVLRTVAMIALLGAAVIHFAYTPMHFDEGTTDGVFFIVVAWCQLAAVAALWQWRDRREPWFGAAAVSAVVTLVWLVSRTAGLPGRDSQDLAWADSVAALLQVVTLVAVVGALLPSVANRPAPRLSPAIGGVAVLAMAVGVSVTMVPSVGHDHDHAHGSGGDHAHGDDGDHAAGDGHDSHGDGHDGHGDGHDHGGEPVELVAREDRCDLGFNTAAFNASAPQHAPVPHDDHDGHDVAFTLEEWADVFVVPEDENPMAHGIESRDQVIDFLRGEPQLEEGVLSGGLAHELDPDPWEPMTDPQECEALADELERTRLVAERYPTAQDAIDDGYRMVTPYLPSIASHYINVGNAQSFDIDNPGMLLYDGNGPDAAIVGISHYLFSEEYPEEGFTGPNDHWHRHIGLCMSDDEGLIIGGTNLTEEECADRGGTKMDGGNQWMSHTWVVPGCESDYGMFSGANPALVARGSTATRDPFDTDENREPIPTGCGSGLAVDDTLGMDDAGDGPSIADHPAG
jgi:hypothetical protein